MTRKRRIALFGASGTMGSQALKELWRRRDEFDISILVLPSDRHDRTLRAYESAAGVPRISGAGVTEGEGLRIVWGDATDPEATAATIAGADAVLNAMAYISPAADYRPQLAWAVNFDAVALILEAIAAEPEGNERIRYLHTGTVAQTGNRPVGVHVGRIGDPLKPSVFDTYALSKIA
ncbi:MAG TPA: NAD-dependent epimerase/dehydratase family protein, partial [Trueperaceae bacterium]|nr:NAD-dependent epimerase/dehydratase family protein [Trueperaceae bacterium]